MRTALMILMLPGITIGLLIGFVYSLTIAPIIGGYLSARKFCGDVLESK